MTPIISIYPGESVEHNWASAGKEGLVLVLGVRGGWGWGGMFFLISFADYSTD